MENVRQRTKVAGRIATLQEKMDEMDGIKEEKKETDTMDGYLLTLVVHMTGSVERCREAQS
jgi:hypothetical protein